MPEVIEPKPGKLYLCRYGFHGAKQVCLFIRLQGMDGYVVRKWRGNSGRWTDGVVIARRDLLARATREDCRTFAVDVTRLGEGAF